MLFQEYFNKYLEFISAKLKPQSIKSIKTRYFSYIYPYFKDLDINNITELVYLKWQNQLNNNNFKYAYKKSLHYTMVAFYNYLDLFYNYNRNIPKRVGNFSNNDLPTDISILNIEEFNTFIKFFVDTDFVYKVLFIFLFNTGCRIGECLALTFNDLNNDVVYINKTISKEKYNGVKMITTPKSRSSIRYIKIDNYLLSLIMQLKKYYSINNKEFNNNFYIFGGKKSLSITTIKRIQKKYCDISNVKQIRLHDFRHSHATFLIKNNIPIIEVSRRLGHSDINITIKTYSHLANEYEKKVVQTFNSFYKNL